MTGLPPPRDLPLFAYGTLADPAFAARLLERAPDHEPARLLDFERLHLEGFDYPTVFEAAGETVDGLAYRDLAAEEIERIDAYEGVAEGLYRRIVGRIVAGEEDETRGPEPAWVYVVTETTVRRFGAL